MQHTTAFQQTLQNAQPLPLPPWFDEFVERTRAGEYFSIGYGKLAHQAFEYKSKLIARGINFTHPSTDAFKFGLVGVDMQNTFGHQKGELFVEGSIEDSIRWARFVVTWTLFISGIAMTMDTHMAFQIFHPIFWLDEKGMHPAAFTPITYKEIKSGVWRVNPAVAIQLGISYPELVRWVLYYTYTLETEGKKTLMVWPYHGKLGGINHAFVAIVEAAIFWWMCLRGAQVHIEMKGTSPLTEMYGAIYPEVMTGPDGTVMAEPQYGLVNNLSHMHAVALAGQAITHCVFSTGGQVDTIASDPSRGAAHLKNRLVIFEDGSSPVTGFELLVPDIMADFRNRGFKVARLTDHISDILVA